jgi:hypothetical protein
MTKQMTTGAVHYLILTVTKLGMGVAVRPCRKLNQTGRTLVLLYNREQA